MRDRPSWGTVVFLFGVAFVLFFLHAVESGAENCEPSCADPAIPWWGAVVALAAALLAAMAALWPRDGD
jgi:drug/metabolite transporter (DMT)-like permease